MGWLWFWYSIAEKCIFIKKFHFLSKAKGGRGWFWIGPKIKGIYLLHSTAAIESVSISPKFLKRQSLDHKHYGKCAKSTGWGILSSAREEKVISACGEKWWSRDGRWSRGFHIEYDYGDWRWSRDGLNMITDIGGNNGDWIWSRGLDMITGIGDDHGMGDDHEDSR